MIKVDHMGVKILLLIASGYEEFHGLFHSKVVTGSRSIG